MTTRKSSVNPVMVEVCFLRYKKADEFVRHISSATELDVKPTLRKGNRIRGRRRIC